MPYLSDDVETREAQGRLATYAYRDFGKGATEPPLVLLHRFRATIDHWDPAFLDVLASERRVIVFDSAGIGRSTGTTPNTIQGMADAAVDFLGALGLHQVDLLGWSMGGYVTQAVALDHPDLVRRIVVAGSGPGGVPGSPERDPRVLKAMTAETNTEEDFLFLFFGLDSEGRRLGQESLARLNTRLDVSPSQVKPESWKSQMEAIGRWGAGENSAWERLDQLTARVLVANGAHDVMVHAMNSFAMVQRVRDSILVLYGDSGHGFLFQHYDEFGRQVLDFLR
ncbi:alpha/beta hydrolase [Actinomadura sp. NBRC 104412]|uniref:alpha/beta fold hydrolase n=1 Tax=Actinomadura sp. NBRC 104412 TaxID=3032203 RepID=UPI00249FED2A|nr:alpha/beta hydrolase [Actinomadura sp. NBRC 104412]GLZ06580.1 alpha/beta hydrolase [Actinomadura sp. NBRC 104412]